MEKDIPVRNRNIAIFRVLRGTGIRESELAGLDLSDLHLKEEMPYITILGKGVYREIQNRTVYLSGSALKALREWLEYRLTLDNIIDTEAVFINKTVHVQQRKILSRYLRIMVMVLHRI